MDFDGFDGYMWMYTLTNSDLKLGPFQLDLLEKRWQNVERWNWNDASEKKNINF